MIKEDKIPDGEWCYRILKDNGDGTLETESCPHLEWVRGETYHCHKFNWDIYDCMKACDLNVTDNDEYCCEFHNGPLKDWKAKDAEKDEEKGL